MEWMLAETAPEGVLLLVYVALKDDDGIDPIGHDIAWKEDGDWMYTSSLNGPNSSLVVTHYMYLPKKPDEGKNA